MKWSYLAVLLMASTQVHVLEVHGASQGATGWPAPGYLGTMQADTLAIVPRYGERYENVVPREVRHDRMGYFRENGPCPSVPVPGSIWLLTSAFIVMTLFAYRVR